jgi:hypothetical protein
LIDVTDSDALYKPLHTPSADLAIDPESAAPLLVAADETAPL